jgi:hypothetical protein
MREMFCAKWDGQRDDQRHADESAGARYAAVPPRACAGTAA